MPCDSFFFEMNDDRRSLLSKLFGGSLYLRPQINADVADIGILLVKVEIYFGIMEKV